MQVNCRFNRADIWQQVQAGEKVKTPTAEYNLLPLYIVRLSEIEVAVFTGKSHQIYKNLAGNQIFRMCVHVCSHTEGCCTETKTHSANPINATTQLPQLNAQV